jgi:hypothetical protein
MSPDAAVLLTLFITALSLGLAGYYLFAAFDQARPMLPSGLHDDFIAHFAIERFIWSGAAPAAARRSYLLSHAYGCVGLFCMTVLAFRNSAAITVWLLAAATVTAGVLTLRCWRRYRAR